VRRVRLGPRTLTGKSPSTSISTFAASRPAPQSRPRREPAPQVTLRSARFQHPGRRGVTSTNSSNSDRARRFYELASAAPPRLAHDANASVSRRRCRQHGAGAGPYGSARNQSALQTGNDRRPTKPPPCPFRRSCGACQIERYSQASSPRRLDTALIGARNAGYNWIGSGIICLPGVLKEKEV